MMKIKFDRHIEDDEVRHYYEDNGYPDPVALYIPNYVWHFCEKNKISVEKCINQILWRKGKAYEQWKTRGDKQ